MGWKKRTTKIWIIWNQIEVKRNTKTFLFVGAAVLILMAVVAVALFLLRPFFNLANVVSGGQ
jgi:hypothetical protein